MTKKVMLLGFGSLGTYIYRAISSCKGVRIVGVVDNSPKKIGKQIGNLGKKRSGSHLTIKGDVSEVKQKADVIVQATTSKLYDAYMQIENVAHLGADVVSTCEELAYPYVVDSKISDKLDRLAKRHKIRVVGVGVNPGFIMDSFPIYVSSVCRNIRKIRVTRSVDLSKRRKALQEKMGVGMTQGEFRRYKESFGHYGLLQSAMLICDKLGKKRVKNKISMKPVLSTHTHSHPYEGNQTRKKEVVGIKHLLSCKQENAKEFLSMNLTMAMGADEYDLVEIDGDPPVRIITDGINGDVATASLIGNYIHALESKSPGLYTVTQLGLVGCKE